MKIVIDSGIPFIKGVLEPYAEVSYLPGSEISRSDIADAQALVVRTRTRCGADLLDGSPVRLIASATIGDDHIDTEYCSRKGIEVAVSAGCNSRGVLQWVGGALAYTSQRQKWEPRHKTIGIVGIGHIGSLVREYAVQWGFDVVCCDPPRQRNEGASGAAAGFVAMEEIVSRCDIITFHVPLTRTGPDATYHMAREEFFKKIRPGALILNSSRGEVIDTEHMIRAVGAGLCSCCIDTWENEPNIDRRMLEASLAATPHIAGYSLQGKAKATAMCVEALAREFSLPLTAWYPSDQVEPVRPAPISWEELKRTITNHFDIESESAALKAHPEKFEEFRNNYPFRQEYF